MIECVFTVDYEIYGNGRGSLRDLVLDPAEKLRRIFRKHNARFVVFPDVAELEMIEAQAADPMIGSVRAQLGRLHSEGFELGLHIHPWWYAARRENGTWVLDQGEYNLCTQPPPRIVEIVDRAAAYLKGLAADPGFVPVSFRAGHLLFQPTRPLADILAARGIRLDSSVYKGGLWRQHKIDYRRAPKTASHWAFRDDVAVPDPGGIILEVPIHTRQELVWKVMTSKRVGLQGTGATPAQTGRKLFGRLADYARLRYPLKFDLGQMTKEEMVRESERLLEEDRKDPSRFRPIVALMHTKDPIAFDAVDALLDLFGRNGVPISTFRSIEPKIRAADAAGGTTPSRRILP